MKDDLVLVTGGTGFIAQHCMLALLNKGYRVRATVRSLGREVEVRQNLRTGGAEPGNRLEFVACDLMADDGWPAAVTDCAYVFHGASPTPSGTYARDEDWIKPAVDGNLRVLRVARDAGVKRVVLTSAFGAIGVGHPPLGRPFNETDWSDLTGNVAPYQKSKTLSERAAWEFIDREGGGLGLSAINPVAVLGPALGPDYSHSIRLIVNMLNGLPVLRINSGNVDVRDVADLHVLAMTDPAANGERFLAISGESMWLIEVARILRERMGHAGRRVAVEEMPDDAVRANPAMKGLVPLLGVNLNATSEKARRLLGWSPRSPEEAIVATAESLVRLGLVEAA